MYYTANPVRIKLAVWKNSSWTIEPVLDSLNLNEYGNMVLDSNDNPHFLIALRRYFGDHTAFLRDVLYISWSGSDWNVQTVASNVTLSNIGFLTLIPDESLTSSILQEQNNWCTPAGQAQNGKTTLWTHREYQIKHAT